MPNGIYSSTLDNVLYAPTAELDWMKRQKINPAGWDYSTLYISSSKVNGSDFPNVVLQAYLRKIRLGVAWSDPAQVDTVIAYNKRQTDPRKKIYSMTTELEAEYANNNCTIAQYRSWIKAAYPKLNAAGIKSFIYEGWNRNYDITVPYSDGFFLHAYRTSAQMATKDDAYGYWGGKTSTGRIRQIAAQAKAIGKIVSCTLLTSCEGAPANDGNGFGFDFYKIHGWADELVMLKDSWDRLATADMKNYVAIDGQYIFKADIMHVLKP